MASVREKLDTLAHAAEERDLTPVAWWIGTAHHDEVLEALADDPGVETQAGRLVEIDGLDVKLLTESPRRFTLWCKEGALDL